MDRVLVFGTSDGGSIPSGRTKMEKIYYNKLVRDKIPTKIESKGSTCEIKLLDQNDFEKELLKKVGEEASGLLSAETTEELISELADIIDVINEIKKVKNISDKQIKEAQKTNFNKKGGFNQRLFLIWSSDDGYKTNEKNG